MRRIENKWVSTAHSTCELVLEHESPGDRKLGLINRYGIDKMVRVWVCCPVSRLSQAAPQRRISAAKNKQFGKTPHRDFDSI